MIRVVVESPYSAPTADGIEENVIYARRALLDSLTRGEAPIASHLLHTQVLDDSNDHSRLVGLDAGHAWLEVTDKVAFYCDRGMSKGMLLALTKALRADKKIEIRWLD